MFSSPPGSDEVQIKLPPGVALPNSSRKSTDSGSSSPSSAVSPTRNDMSWEMDSLQVPFKKIPKKKTHFVFDLKNYENIGQALHSEAILKVQLKRGKNLASRVCIAFKCRHSRLFQDSNGFSDPYVMMYISQKTRCVRSRVIDKSLDPVWNEVFYLSVDAVNISEEILHIEVWDKDLITDGM